MAATIKTVGVIGAGQMGNGIAHVCALAGYDVKLNDISADRIKAGMATINGNMAKQVSKKTITEDDRKVALARIGAAEKYDDLGACDLVIETAIEKEEAKRKIYSELCPSLKPEAILATNTSSISITRLAATTDRPERFIGIHFMNPVPLMELVEVIRGIATDDATFEQGVDGVYLGRERIHQAIVKLADGNPGPGLPFGRLNEHFQLQPVITIADDGQSARGRWHELSMTGQYGEHAEWGEGVYENAYRKDAGVWKIAALRFYPNFVAPYEGGWALLKPVEGDWRSPALADLPPDRPPSETYRPFPHMFVPPFHYAHPVTGKAVAQ